MPRALEISGQRFSHLVAVRPTGRSHVERGRLWDFRCDCGQTIRAAAGRVKIGHIKSCGCWLRGVMKSKGATTHGKSKSATYVTWYGMLSRCRNPRNSNYKHYGGRGIEVCSSWFLFENFLGDMGERPKGKTLDRIDVNGDYEPGNCRWADAGKQSRNRATTKLYTYNGKTMCMSEWIREIRGGK